MREIPPGKVVLYGTAVVGTGVFSFFLRRIPRMKRFRWWAHALYMAAVGVTLMLLPEWIQDEIFSPGGVLLVGTILPVYNSIVAVCSIDAQDDKMWLQFWMTWASLSFLTEFMDDITARLPSAGEHWFEFEFFTVMWLILPFTNGASIFYEKITEPFLTPIAVRVQTKMEGWIQLVLTLVNTSYIWMIWYAFVRLPENQRRFVVVGLGTVYPVAASIVAVSQKDVVISGLETSSNKPVSGNTMTTYWLTYWSVYMLLFVIMDYIEIFVGHIRGFYSLCAFATIYLALPMFNGADVVFRRVLVPLSGQYEEMLLRDAWMVRQQMQASLPEKYRSNAFVRAAQLFLASDPKKGTKES